MPFVFEVPNEYGYVVLTTAATFWVGFWHAFRTSGFRQAAGIVHPQVMATPEQIVSAPTPEKKKAMYLFNCAQRAHNNWVENVTGFLPAMLIAGLRYPITSAVLGLAWNVSRVVYAVGYTRTDREEGKGRAAGGWFFLFQMALFALTGWTGYKMLVE